MHKPSYTRMAVLVLASLHFTSAAAGAGGTVGVRQKPASSNPADRVNLLFILTDQQRFDALGRAGNSEISTPNLDALARVGAYFVNAYSPSPMCVPARTAILTGHSLSTVRVTRNDDINRPDAAPVPSFDNILAGAGYHTEYHGKWHAPYKLAATYENTVRPSNKIRNAPEGVLKQVKAFQRFVREHVAPRPPAEGELLDVRSGRPYRPDFEWVRILGRLDLPSEFGRTAFTVKETIQALQRMKDSPFSLTCSITAPHPPFLVSEPYHSMYSPQTLSLPVSLGDPMINSPHREQASLMQAAGYRDARIVRRWKANYYGMVTEVDFWVGQLLARLKELGLEKNTLVIFTSDHGELLGDHGMGSKSIHYEGAVHVPLLIRLPGRIPPGTVVEAPVSTMDLFATILDYTGQTDHASHGRPLRGLIEGTETSGPDYCISERPLWLMIRTARWKLLFPAGSSGDNPALYDLENDPHELNNLLGYNPDRKQYAEVGQELKDRLVAWLEKVESPHLESVRRRPVVR